MLFEIDTPQLTRTVLPGWSYCTSCLNFYIANGGIVTPKFGIPEDDTARAAIGATFADRAMVQVDISEIAGCGGGHQLYHPAEASVTPALAERAGPWPL